MRPSVPTSHDVQPVGQIRHVSARSTIARASSTRLCALSARAISRLCRVRRSIERALVSICGPRPMAACLRTRPPWLRDEWRRWSVRRRSRHDWDRGQVAVQPGRPQPETFGASSGPLRESRPWSQQGRASRRPTGTRDWRHRVPGEGGPMRHRRAVPQRRNDRWTTGSGPPIGRATHVTTVLPDCCAAVNPRSAAIHARPVSPTLVRTIAAPWYVIAISACPRVTMGVDLSPG